jgi:CRP/FNR family transcriptional regulator, cyclic AMP receptor protein
VELDPTAFVADPELIAVLEKKATLLDCASERVLFAQGDPPAGLYLLRSGTARLTMDSAEGKPIVSLTVPEGSLLGLPGVLANQPYTLTAIAQAGAVVGFIPRDEFTALMHKEPIMALKMLAVLAAEVRSARRAIA